MTQEQLFRERVVRVERPTSHYTLLRASDGRFLGTADGASLEAFDYADDKTVWQQLAGPDAYRHVTSGLTVTAEPTASGCFLRQDGAAVAVNGAPAEDAAVFFPEHGPAQLPSEYLKTFRE